MTAKKKLAHKRLTLLQLAEKLGNVSKACRLHKLSRSRNIVLLSAKGFFDKYWYSTELNKTLNYKKFTDQISGFLIHWEDVFSAFNLKYFKIDLVTFLSPPKLVNIKHFCIKSDNQNNYVFSG